MTMAAGSASPTYRAPPALAAQAMAPIITDTSAKDALLAWFRGEFAAANAIIDALCSHLTILSNGGSEYDDVFAAIHRRRLNWIPVLQMQRYYSIAHVAVELCKVTEATKKVEIEKERAEVFYAEAEINEEEEVEVENNEVEDVNMCLEEEEEKVDEQIDEKVDEQIDEKVMETDEKVTEINENGDGEEDDSPTSEITDSGSQEMHHNPEEIDVCSNHQECEARKSHINLTKGFSAKEPVKGHMVNVVKGLKLYDNFFTASELFKLNHFVDQLRSAGQNGELSGETFIMFNQQVKGNRRELIQLGVSIFGQVKDEVSSNSRTCNIDPIPSLLQSVIDHMVQWQLIPEYKKPNGCTINFFEERFLIKQGEHSQPFQKPPHLDHPISTLFLSESTVAFGRTLVSDNDGNYKGPLMLTLKQGSLLVMRGNSADMSRHVMCPSENKRVSITFFRVRADTHQYCQSPTSPITTSLSGPSATTLWQQAPLLSSSNALPNGALCSYESMEMMPKWGALRGPVLMLAPVRPMVVSSRRVPRGGTGVFLPWTVGTRKPAKHLPPRAQKDRLLALPSPMETHVAVSASVSG